MKQGTMSVLFGCHSVIHSLLVWRSWRIVHGKWPKPWQVMCIFLHDIGHCGRDYLDDYEQKKHHWYKGSCYAFKMFGWKGYYLTAGHCTHSKERLSEMYKPDKYSWHIAPRWWLYLNCVFEPKLAMGYDTWKEAIDRFKEQVAKSVESGEFKSTHSMFLERCNPVGITTILEAEPRNKESEHDTRQKRLQ